MADIGKATPEFPLYLPTMGDWVYNWSVSGDPLNPAHELYITFDDNAIDDFEFVIAGDGLSAGIKVERETHILIKAGTTYYLMTKDPTTTPTTERELQKGQVER